MNALRDVIKSAVDSFFAVLEGLAAGRPFVLLAIKAAHRFASEAIDQLFVKLAAMPA